MVFDTLAVAWLMVVTICARNFYFAMKLVAAHARGLASRCETRVNFTWEFYFLFGVFDCSFSKLRFLIILIDIFSS